MLIKKDEMHEIHSLISWLKNSSLPFWKKYGIDYKFGGFFELLDSELEPINMPRRTRLIARQIFSFSKGYELVHQDESEDIIENGLSFLEKFLIKNSGQVYKSIDIETNHIDKSHDLYDYAFLIFAMSKIYKKEKFQSKSLEISIKSLNWINNFWRHKEIGFIEDPKNSIICRANPHMHLLEASLSWEENDLQINKKVWEKLSDEIIDLSITKLIDPKRKILHELFDPNWNLSLKPDEQYIEPGHQYEWAWLIIKWCNLRKNYKYIEIANELINNAEKYGYDKKRKVCINSLDCNLKYLDRKAKLWPQTERLKALLYIESFSSNKTIIRNNINDAIQSIKNYLQNTDQKIWHECIDEKGNFTLEPTKASSFYHIVTALCCLEDYFNSNKKSF